MASAQPPHKSDIFRKQRELARAKYASSDEEDDDGSSIKPSGGPPKPPDDDDGHGNNDETRGHGKSGAGGGDGGRGQKDSSSVRSSAPFGGLKSTSNGKRRLEDQSDLRDNEDGRTAHTRVAAPMITPVAQTIAAATLQTDDSAPLKLADKQTWRKSTISRTAEQCTTRSDTRSITSIPSFGSTEASSSWSSSQTFGVPFSFTNPAIQLLAAEICIKLLLGECLAAFKSGRPKAKLTPQECSSFKNAARHAYGIAKGLEADVMAKTMARCYYFIGLTEVLYSVDSSRKSDLRGLKWFRKTLAYRGTTESDHARLWIKELDAPGRAQSGEHHTHTAHGGNANGLGRQTYVLPDHLDSPLSKTKKWLSGLVSRPASSASEDQRSDSGRMESSQRTPFVADLRKLSPTQSGPSNRELLLQGGPVGVRESDSLSERSLSTCVSSVQRDEEHRTE